MVGSLSMWRHLSLWTTGSRPSKEVCSSGLDSPNTGNPSSLSEICCDRCFIFNKGAHFLCEHTGLREQNFLIRPMMTGSRGRERHFWLIFEIYLVCAVMDKPTSRCSLSILFGSTFNPQELVSSFTLLQRWCSFCSHLFLEGGRNPGP